MWRLVISEYGRSWGGSELQGKPHSETIEFLSLQEARCWFQIMSERDADARPWIKAKLYDMGSYAGPDDKGRLMFEISRTKNMFVYRWEFVPSEPERA